MSGFQFPPPPPPPPRASQQSQQPPSFNRDGSQSRGRGRGGSNRGSNSRGHIRPVNAAQPRSDGYHSQNYSAAQGARPTPHHESRPTSWSSVGYRQPVIPQNTVIPPGSYVNPAFNFGNQGSGGSYASAGSNTLLPSGPPGPGYDAGGLSTSSPSRTAAGHKRKLEALRSSPLDKIVNPPTAPSVPTFGSPILAVHPSSSDLRKPQPRPGQRSSSNALGLTPQLDDPHYSSSEAEVEDEDVDEEAMFAELGTKLTFEHNGVVMSLSSSADLAQWKSERAKNFPTRSRMLAKLDEKRVNGEIRRRLLTEAVETLRASGKSEDASKVLPAPHRTDAAPEPSEVADGEVHGGIATGPQTDSAVHLGKPDMNMSSAEQLAVDGSELEGEHPSETEPSSDIRKQESSAVSGLDDQSKSAGGAPIGDYENVVDGSDDSGPEQMTSKQPPTRTQPSAQLCRYFTSRGSCRDGAECRFRHDLSAVERNRNSNPGGERKDRNAARMPDAAVAGRKGIHQALLDQQTQDHDQLALEVIKYLGRAGFFSNQ